MEITQFLQQNVFYILAALLFLWMAKASILAKIYNLQSIHSQEAFQLLQKKPEAAVFLDIRTKWELEREPRIKKSISIPLSDISSRIDEIKQLSSEKQLIIVCNSGGGRAKSAGVKLKKAGISDIYVLKGGMQSWRTADYPVTKVKVKVGTRSG